LSRSYGKRGERGIDVDVICDIVIVITVVALSFFAERMVGRLAGVDERYLLAAFLERSFDLVS
jgi:hypothetical protein